MNSTQLSWKIYYMQGLNISVFMPLILFCIKCLMFVSYSL